MGKGLLAALMMFTRLPLWRVAKVDRKYYTGILLYWPVVGFLTGITTWGVTCLAALFMPVFPACVLGVCARLLLTGALHEDGLADFFDGFGGGHDREGILRIMKDSHIGSYGTLGLIAYFLLYVSLLTSLPLLTVTGPGIVIGADVFSKLVTAVMINSLPYARTEADSKVKLLYRRIRPVEFMLMAVFCLGLLGLLAAPFAAMVPALLTVGGLRIYFSRKIGGYTGDCCGAAVLLTEQAFYLGAVVFFTCYS